MTSEPEIEELEASLRRAMLAGDVETLDALLADALIFTTHTGALATKEMDLAPHRSGALRLTALRPAEQQIRRLGDVAVVSVQMEVAGEYGGNAFAGLYRYLRVWARTGERWQVIAAQVTAVQAWQHLRTDPYPLPPASHFQLSNARWAASFTSASPSTPIRSIACRA